ncbi:MAG: magnesium transporter [Verrucomicrobia bacterium]|jgi:magnesium transporter|nr:magnesium transporter [Verrucomicrobiota bacterium]
MPKLHPNIERIVELIHLEEWDQIRSALASWHPADIADVIDLAPRDAQDRLFTLLSDDAKPDVLSELDSYAESEVVESLTNAELSEIVEEMDPDDAADIIGDLSDQRSSEVLELMQEEESEEVRRLLKYEEDTAGGIMTPDVVSMRSDQTVGEAIEAIAYLDEGEPFVYAYIVSEGERLTGYIDIWELLREKNRQRPLSELCHTEFVAANVNDDQEDVAHLLSQYDISSIPVIDDDGRIVGRVTVDDVIDVIEEEASEDIFRLAGSDDIELETDSPVRSCIARLPWLLVTLFGGLMISLILKQFHARISSVIILGAFVPAVLAMGGNTGIQASTLVVRTIALRGMEGKSITRLLLREIAVGAIMGTICGLCIGGWALVWLRGAPEPGFSSMRLASVVAIALFCAMSFAAVFGALVPIVLNKLRVDPAVASGPFVTITNDLAALLIYFGTTIALLPLA